MNPNQHRLVVYGSSMVFAGIASLLQQIEGLEILLVAPGTAPLNQLVELKPDIVLYDCREVSLPLHKFTGPQNVVLLGLDLDAGQAYVMNRQSYPVQHPHELTALIRSTIQAPA